MRNLHPGLCAGCRHARLIVSDRGSRFLQCRAADRFPELAKYPPLPVLRCRAFQPPSPDSGRAADGCGDTAECPD